MVSSLGVARDGNYGTRSAVAFLIFIMSNMTNPMPNSSLSFVDTGLLTNSACPSVAAFVCHGDLAVEGRDLRVEKPNYSTRVDKCSWYQAEEARLPDGSVFVARDNVLQSLTRFTNEAIEELEHLLDSRAKEVAFQHFFERHPEFLLALGDYKTVHPQLILHEDSGEKLIPDFFLERMNGSFCDICDLKRSTSAIVRRQRHRNRLRDGVMEVIAQLEHYRNWFEDTRNQREFHSAYGLRGFRPRVVALIGRRQDYYSEVERIRLEDPLPPWVQLRTYDDVVDKARLWRAIITSP